MKIFAGEVIANKMPKTATVAVEKIFTHPLYLKRVKKTRKYQVHDPEGKTKAGDKVRFVASRPVSKSSDGGPNGVSTRISRTSASPGIW